MRVFEYTRMLANALAYSNIRTANFFVHSAQFRSPSMSQCASQRRLQEQNAVAPGRPLLNPSVYPTETFDLVCARTHVCVCMCLRVRVCARLGRPLGLASLPGGTAYI